MTETLADLAVSEEIGVQRDAEVIVTGLPFPAGSLLDTTDLAVRDEDGQVGAVQVLSRRGSDDGSVHWVALAFVAKVPAVGTKHFSVVRVDVVPCPQTGVDVQEDATSADVIVSWCGQRILLRPGRFLIRPGVLLPKGLATSAVLDGHLCVGVVDSIEVIHRGPLLAELRLTGGYECDGVRHAGLRARVRVQATTPSIDVDLAVVVTGPTTHTELGGWTVEIGTGAVQTALVGVFEQGARSEPPLAIEHLGGGHPRGIFSVTSVVAGSDWQDASEAGYRDTWEWAELHGRQAQNWCVLSGSHRPTTVAVERFSEHYPARIAVDRDAVRVQFRPPELDPIPLTRGVAPRRRLRIQAGEDRRAGAVLDNPLVARAVSATFAGRPPILRYSPDRLPNLESLIRDEVFNWYQSGQSLGFYDHGDGIQGTPAGPRLGYSSNNEHDAIYALLLHYLRSGERAYLDSAIAYADHTVDIDVIHDSAYPHEVGAVRAHGLGHVKYVESQTATGSVQTSIDTGHMWTEGLVLLSQITGESRYLDAACGIADCLLRLEDLGWTRPEPGPRNAGWPLIALTSVAAVTGDERYLAGARRIATLAAERQHPDGRWLMRLGYLRDYCAWQNAVLITGLDRLQQLDPAPALRSAIERGGKAMLDLGRTPEGTFVYLTRYDYRWPQRSGLVREALAGCYRLTGDMEYLAAGLLGGGRWYPQPGRPRVTSEDIANWRGHLPFLAHADEAGLLEDLP